MSDADKLDFDQWCDKLDEIARREYGFAFDYTKASGRDCWQQYFNAGSTPEDALREDLSYD